MMVVTMIWMLLLAMSLTLAKVLALMVTSRLVMSVTMQ